MCLETQFSAVNPKTTPVPEHIDEELIPYLQLYSTNVVKENVGEYTKDYKDYYNEQTIQIVADWYAQDIDYWGFDFDTSATKNYHYEKEI